MGAIALLKYQYLVGINSSRWVILRRSVITAFVSAHDTIRNSG